MFEKLNHREIYTCMNSTPQLKPYLNVGQWLLQSVASVWELGQGASTKTWLNRLQIPTAKKVQNKVYFPLLGGTEWVRILCLQKVT